MPAVRQGENRMSIKAKIEAIIYAAEEPITLEQILALVKDEARRELIQQREVEASTAENADADAELIPAEEEHQSNLAAEPLGAPPLEGLLDPSAALPSDQSEAAQAAPPTAITDAEIKAAVRTAIEELVDDYISADHGIEIRQIAGGYRMATKPEHHDAVRAFAKSLKPPVRLSLQALETLAVIAYKQPVTAPEISDIRGVDCSGVLGTLLERKFITTAGRKQVIGRPILYKTTKEFLLRFGLKDVGELPSMEEFEKLAAESLGSDLLAPAAEPASEASAEPPASAEAATAAGNGTEADNQTRETDAPADRES